MKKLNLYMRAVAVTSLIVVAGVGVYKGRNMLAAKDKPAVADATAAAGASPTATDATTATGAGAAPKSSAPASKAGKSTANTAASKAKSAAPAGSKAAKLGGFKFGSFGKSGEKAKSTATESPAAAAPAAESTAADTGSYNLNDTPAPVTAPTEEQYAAATPDAAASGGFGATGYEPAPYGDTAAAPTVVGEAAPADPTLANDNTASYSENGQEPAAPVAAPYGDVPYGDTSAQDTYAASEPTLAGSDNPAAAPSTSLPPDQLPTYGTGDTGGYAATNEPSPAVPSVAASEASLSDVSGAMPETAAPLAPPTFGGSAPRMGAASSSAVTSNAAGSTAPYGSPPSSASSSRGLPPNQLPSNALGSSLATPGTAPAERYAPATGAAMNSSAALNSGGTVQPHLEGPQTPTIAVEKFAPPEVQVGKAALFEIVVKNVGKVAAYDVTVVDEVPAGTRFQQASPQPTQSQGKSLLWKFGVMQPGEEQIIELQLVPETEGEIGSIAQVSFQAQAGARSVVTRPRLEIQHQAPTQVHAGENATVLLTITNTGSGAATNVLLQSDVPQGFSHPAGQELEFEVGTLRPSESKQVELVLKAEQAGDYEGVFVIRGDGGLVVQDSARLQVVAPSLQVAVTGPKKRFVERQATHAITIANPGTAAAKDVDIVAHLPRGFKFISADHQGQYDSRQHAVVWGLEELPPGASGSVQLTTLPIEAGEQKLRVEGRSANGLTADFEQLVAVDAVSELMFTVADLADPIEVASETAYEIRLSNRGAKGAANVVVVVDFPAEMKPLDGEGATRASVAGQRLQFAPIVQIAPGAEVVLRARAQGVRAGDHRIAVSLVSDEQQTPVTREESTRVYADQ
jgi:uncharacterized repeat protein (TIGR01451 family)